MRHFAHGADQSSKETRKILLASNIREELNSMKRLLSMPLRPAFRIVIVPAIALEINLIFATACSQANPSYSATRLQVPANTISTDPAGLDSHGRVGGRIRVDAAQSQQDLATVWSTSGEPMALPVPSHFSRAGVNGFAGSIPLGYVTLEMSELSSACYWGPQGLMILPDFGEGAAAMGGNGSQIVGVTFAVVPGNSIHGNATIWDSNVPTRIAGLTGSYSLPFGINAGGAYVGSTIDLSTGQRRGFVGIGANASVISYSELDVTSAFAINDSGWFTGLWQGPNLERRAYVAREQEIYDLGLFPGFNESWARAINNQRTVVGAAGSSGSLSRALVWYDAGPPQDLNTLTFNLPPSTTLLRAEGINNAGQILAAANDGFYVLTPIPEPAGLLITLAGVILSRGRARSIQVFMTRASARESL